MVVTENIDLPWFWIDTGYIPLLLGEGGLGTAIVLGWRYFYKFTLHCNRAWILHHTIVF